MLKNLSVKNIWMIVVLAFFACCCFVILPSCDNSNVDGDDYEEEDQSQVEEVKSVEKFNIMNAILQAKVGQLDYNQIISKQVTIADKIPIGNQILTFGDKKPSADSLANLDKAVKDFETTTNEPLSFVLYDLNSDCGITYKIDKQTYLASTIKLPFLASVIESKPEVFNNEIEPITAILQHSDNDAYESMRNRYPNTYLKSWAEQLKISHDVWTYYFPSFCDARDMLKLWFKTFYFLNTNANSEKLGELTMHSDCSAIYEAFPTKYKTSTKPGWLDAPWTSPQGYSFHGITHDCGVIYAGENPYLVVVLSELPGDQKTLSKIFTALDLAHSTMWQ